MIIENAKQLHHMLICKTISFEKFSILYIEFNKKEKVSQNEWYEFHRSLYRNSNISDESFFWDVIEKMDWRNNSNVEEQISYLENKYTEEERIQLSTKLNELLFSLKIEFNLEKDFNFDLINEIVSMGKETFYSISRKQLFEMLDNENYNPSFYNCFTCLGKPGLPN